MPKQKRIPTAYPGVYYVEAKALGSDKNEKIYYIRYRRDGKIKEEKAGRQYANDMTPSRAATIRSKRIEGKELSNEDKRQNEKVKSSIWTIQRLWDEYKTQNTHSKSFRADNNRFKLYLRDKFGPKEPSKLVQLDIDRLRIRVSKNKSPQTVKHILALLKRVVNFGINKGLCSGPAFKIQLPKVNNLKTEDLTPGQLKKLLYAAEKDKHPQAGNIIKLALFTGMRRGEIFKLQWRDIDFHRGFIHIRDPKGGSDQKTPLNDSSRILLKSIERTKSHFVFPGRGGQQRVDINHQVNRIKTAAGLPKDFRPLHGLRHVYASMLASSGEVDMYTLQKLLTHKSPTMTQRYAHLRDETLRNAANLASDIISQALVDSEEKKTSKK